MIDTIEADDAWWPPTLTSPAGRSWLAWSMMRTANHRTRCSISASTLRSVMSGSRSDIVSGWEAGGAQALHDAVQVGAVACLDGHFEHGRLDAELREQTLVGDVDDVATELPDEGSHPAQRSRRVVHV